MEKARQGKTGGAARGVSGSFWLSSCLLILTKIRAVTSLSLPRPLFGEPQERLTVCRSSSLWVWVPRPCPGVQGMPRLCGPNRPGLSGAGNGGSPQQSCSLWPLQIQQHSRYAGTTQSAPKRRQLHRRGPQIRLPAPESPPGTAAPAVVAPAPKLPRPEPAGGRTPVPWAASAPGGDGRRRRLWEEEKRRRRRRQPGATGKRQPPGPA